MNLQKLCMTLVTSLFLFGCVNYAVKFKQVENIPVQNLQASENSKSIQLKKIVVKLKRGEKFGRYFDFDGVYSLVWAPEPNWKLWEHDPKWGIANQHFSLERDMFTKTFNEELEKYSFKTVGNTPDALFEDPSSWKPEILVAGLIQEMKASVSYHRGFGSHAESKAKAFLKITWQIYSNLDRTVIHTVTSEGEGKTEGYGYAYKDATQAGGDFAFYRAFAQATRGLLADKMFREIVSSGQESLKSQ